MIPPLYDNEVLQIYRVLHASTVFFVEPSFHNRVQLDADISAVAGALSLSGVVCRSSLLKASNYFVSFPEATRIVIPV